MRDRISSGTTLTATASYGKITRANGGDPRNGRIIQIGGKDTFQIRVSFYFISFGQQLSMAGNSSPRELLVCEA
jgi:hypothetical protein